MAWEPSKLVLGIRHDRIFRFISNRGQLIDAVLALQGKGPFPKGCFPRVQWKHDDTYIILKDDSSGVSLEYTIDGFILTCECNKMPDFKIKSIGEMCKSLLDISSKILDVSNGINRVGIIHEYIFPKTKNSASFLSDLILKKSFDAQGHPEEFQFRTVLRYSDEKALAVNSVDDFKNVIVSIGNRKDEDLPHGKAEDILLTIDFQKYYKPPRKSSSIELDKHIQSAGGWCNKMSDSVLKSLQVED